MMVVGDLRRRVAFRAYGSVRMLRWVQAALEDIEGAIGKEQYGAAAVQARFFVLGCLSVRSLARDGEIEFDVDSVSFDFLSGVPADEIQVALSLAEKALDLDDAADAADWLGRLRMYAADTEALLGYDRPLPVLRTPEGAFGLIGIARDWVGVLDELGLPSPLPVEWIPRALDPG
jgi:hypothetical protein